MLRPFEFLAAYTYDGVGWALRMDNVAALISIYALVSQTVYTVNI